MKAKDVLEKKGILFMSNEHEKRFESAMKEYAKLKCKEQRALCEKSWLDEQIRNKSNHVKMMAIRNAPEPEFD